MDFVKSRVTLGLEVDVSSMSLLLPSPPPLNLRTSPHHPNLPTSLSSGSWPTQTFLSFLTLFALLVRNSLRHLTSSSMRINQTFQQRSAG